MGTYKPRTQRTPTTARSGKMDYRIPALWDCWGYSGPRDRTDGQIVVNATDYATACFEWIRAQNPDADAFQGRSLSQIVARQRRTGKRTFTAGRKQRGGSWIASQVMYGMMVRTTTAWDHDGNGRIRPHGDSTRYAEYGTFLKCCLLMPLLQKMGMTTLYLLPVVKVSNLFRKGSLGCPYSAKNFLELDASQHDPLFGDDPASVAAEFGMFVDCAHRLGMRVMLDVAPRTAARDCDWILENPEWFYWIDRRYAKRYASPTLPTVDYGNPKVGRLHEIYSSPAVREHLAQFRFAPNITHPRAWKQFVTECRRRPPQDLIAEIAERFGVITPPGFSDVINDPQPPWSDVTYLRLYKDHAPEAADLLDDPQRQPPYVLFDTIKANLFPARQPNQSLWNRLANIIPFYQRFGIDGARVDMAHALPKALEEMILRRPRQRDPDFAFIAEDLGYDRTQRHRSAGYNLVLGPAYYLETRAAEGLAHRMLADLPNLALPILGAAETPDSPRTAVRKGGPRFSRWAAVVNMFLPNAVPMINSGMEVLERQPMNLGLDVGRPGRFALAKSDPQYGKLAFFDPYALHWTNRGGAAMVELLSRVAALRQQYARFICAKGRYFAPNVGFNARRVLATGFAVTGRHRSLLMLANVDFDKPCRTSVLDLPRPHDPQLLLELESSPPPKLVKGRLLVALPPGDVKVILV